MEEQGLMKENEGGGHGVVEVSSRIGEGKMEREGERTRWKNGVMKENEEGGDGGVEVSGWIEEEEKGKRR